MSQLLWKLRDGSPIALPVSACGTAWWISAHACVANLLHAATLDPVLFGPRCVVQMPALHLELQAVVDALCRAFGEDRRTLVRFEPQAIVQRLFATYPPLLTPRAEAIGFRHDCSADELVRRALMP